MWLTVIWWCSPARPSIIFRCLHSLAACYITSLSPNFYSNFWQTAHQYHSTLRSEAIESAPKEKPLQTRVPAVEAHWPTGALRAQLKWGCWNGGISSCNGRYGVLRLKWVWSGCLGLVLEGGCWGWLTLAFSVASLRSELVPSVDLANQRWLTPLMWQVDAPNYQPNT